MPQSAPLPPSWTTRVEQTYDAEGNLDSIRRTLSGAGAAASLLSADYRSAGRLSRRTVTTVAGAAIARECHYEESTGRLDDFKVSAGGYVVAGSRVE